MKASAPSQSSTTSRQVWLCAALIFSATLPQSAAAADPVLGHVTGIGGVFVKSKDPKALAAWYRDMIGITLEPWGGAMLRYDGPLHPPVVVWNALPSDSSYLAPSSR